MARKAPGGPPRVYLLWGQEDLRKRDFGNCATPR